MIGAGLLLMAVAGFLIGASVAGFWLGVALGMFFLGAGLIPVAVMLDRWGLL